MAYGIKTKDASGNVTLDTSAGPLIRIVDVIRLTLANGAAFTPITKPEYAGCIVKGSVSPSSFVSAAGAMVQMSEDILLWGSVHTACHSLLDNSPSTPAHVVQHSIPPGMFYISGTTLNCRYRPSCQNQANGGLDWTLLIMKAG